MSDAVEAVASPVSEEQAPVATADPAKVRALMIKTGVVKRLAKEKLSYDKEVVDQMAKIEQYKKEEKDEYFMKQQLNCLSESKQMIPDVQRRFVTAYAELKELFDGVPEDDPIVKTKEYEAARAMLEETKDQLVWS